MPTLNLVITDAGMAAITNAQSTGTLPVVLSQVALGTGRWNPDHTAVALLEPLKVINTVGGSSVADDTIHVTMTDDSADAYSLGEFGLITDGGVLFAIYSDPDGITDKAANTLLLEALDIQFLGLPPNAVTVGDAGFFNPPATEAQAGVAKLASQALANAGANDTDIMTALKTKVAVAQYQYTADQALAGISNTGTLAQLVSWVTGMIKAITGKADWKTAPATSLEAAAAHHAAQAPHAGHETPAGAQTKVDTHAALTAPHGATSAATASRLIVRDVNGRAQVAAPSAAADIARKDTIDNAISGLGALATKDVVAQGLLKTTYNDLSWNGGWTQIVLPGGAYGFYPQLRSSVADNAGVVINEAGLVIGTSFQTVISIGTSGSTVYVRQRYVQASPPYDLGDGDVPIFIYVEVDQSGNIVGTWASEDPPWANNGPTNITADMYWRGKAYKFMERLPLTLVDVKAGTASYNEYLAERAKATYEFVEITQAMKQADMPLLPHPFRPEEGNSVLLLDPVDTLSLRDLHNEGESISDLLRDGYLILDNAAVNRSAPPGVIPVPVRWRSS